LIYQITLTKVHGLNLITIEKIVSVNPSVFSFLLSYGNRFKDDLLSDMRHSEEFKPEAVKQIT